MTKRRQPRAKPQPSAAQTLIWRVPPVAWIAAAIVPVTFIAYRSALSGTLVWDDAAHIVRPDLEGLGGLWRIWFEIGATQQYYPIVHSVFWAVSQSFGDATWPFHVLNVSLHAGSAVLLAVVLRYLAIPGAVFVAALFALHPVHVESVAWMSELKNTLSGTFYLAAVWSYLKFDDTRHVRHYVLALVFFVCALLAKTVTATLPAALLIVLWWRRGRLDVARDIRPVLPMCALAVIAGATTAVVEHTLIGARGEEFDFSLIDRCLIAGRAVWSYFTTLIWPVNLSFNYPRWQIDAGVWWQYVFPIGVIAALAVAWRYRRYSRAPLAGILFFLVTLLPALGFVNVFPFRYSFVADHFQYLASIGVIVPLGAGIVLAGRRLLQPTWQAGWATAIAAILALVVADSARRFTNAEALWRDTLHRNPASRLALTNLATLLMDRPAQVNEAVTLLRQALRLSPSPGGPGSLLGREYLEANCTLTLALARAGRLRELAEPRKICRQLAIDQTKVLAVRREIRRQVGAVHLRRGQIKLAVAEFQAAAALGPPSDDLRALLAGILQRHAYERSRLNQLDEAIAVLEEAPAIAPRSISAAIYNDLGVAYAMAGRAAQASAAFARALAADPKFEAARNNLAKLGGGG